MTIHYLNPRGLKPDEFELFIKSLALKAIKHKNFNADFEEFVCGFAVDSTKPVRKWFEPFPMDLPAGLSAEHIEALRHSFGKLLDQIKADFLGALLLQSYLRASVTRQALDNGLIMVPVKDL